LSVECKKNIAKLGAGTIGQRIARVCAQPGYSARLYNTQFAGVPFFNPVHTAKLAEIVRGASTNERTIEALKSFAANDSSGFIMNRVPVPFFLEPLKTVENGIADFKTIDSLRRSTGVPAGTFESTDQGIGTILAVTSSIRHAFSHDSKFRPSRIQ
jgi:3-hydroxybutyryl-CoA dehydrogenase